MELECQGDFSIQLAGSPCHKDLFSQGLDSWSRRSNFGPVWSKLAAGSLAGRADSAWPATAWEALPDHVVPVLNNWKK